MTSNSYNCKLSFFAIKKRKKGKYEKETRKREDGTGRDWVGKSHSLWCGCEPLTASPYRCCLAIYFPFPSNSINAKWANRYLLSNSERPNAKTPFSLINLQHWLFHVFLYIQSSLCFSFLRYINSTAPRQLPIAWSNPFSTIKLLNFTKNHPEGFFLSHSVFFLFFLYILFLLSFFFSLNSVSC